MKYLLLIAGLMLSFAVQASPLLVSDPIDPSATSCGIYMDALPKVTSPVGTDATGKPICKYDLSAVPVGTHTFTATQINATEESPKSSTVTYIVHLPAPTNMRITP